MSNTIAEYYTDELVDWRNAIAFCNNEIDEFERKLAEVISRNSIIDIAQKVEAQQDLLNKISKKFYRLEMEIQEQKATLKTDNTLIDNALINDKIEKRQMELRAKYKQWKKNILI